MAGHLRCLATALLLGLLPQGVSTGVSGEALSAKGVLRSDSTWTVTSTANSGAGTLREALQGAGYGDLINFNSSVFPMGSPGTIHLTGILPSVTQGCLTIDAIGAGVILDGSGLAGDAVGLHVLSDSNCVRGLQILHFPGSGMKISSEAAENCIEENTISSNGGSCGLEILGARNVVSGNFIGTDAGGTMGIGNSNHGICIGDSSGNHIGPGNVVAHNGGVGIRISGVTATGNTITQNSVTANSSEGIRLDGGGNSGLPSPVITVCVDTLISGTAPPDCIIEVFSDDDAEGEIYEGMALSDGTGLFSFTKPSGFAGPDITATATDSTGNTSAFSPAASVAIEPTTWGEIKAGFRD